MVITVQRSGKPAGWAFDSPPDGELSMPVPANRLEFAVVKLSSQCGKYESRLPSITGHPRIALSSSIGSKGMLKSASAPKPIPELDCISDCRRLASCCLSILANRFSYFCLTTSRTTLLALRTSTLFLLLPLAPAAATSQSPRPPPPILAIPSRYPPKPNSRLARPSSHAGHATGRGKLMRKPRMTARMKAPHSTTVKALSSAAGRASVKSRRARRRGIAAARRTGSAREAEARAGSVGGRLRAESLRRGAPERKTREKRRERRMEAGGGGGGGFSLRFVL